MDKELINYAIWNCRSLMLVEEIKALTQLTLREEAKQRMLEAYQSGKGKIYEKFYGFEDEKVRRLAELGEEKLKERIAGRI